MSFNDCSSVLSKYNLGNTNQIKFLNFVYSKISKNTKNRFVDKNNNNSIDILLSNHPPIKIIPIFKQINKEELFLNEEIAQAIKTINNSEFKYVYFVYPKNENFDKHIQIKIQQLEKACSEYVVKIIPYSLSDLNKTNKRKCNVSNILC